jgi:uncharacterized membrane protein
MEKTHIKQFFFNKKLWLSILFLSGVIPATLVALVCTFVGFPFFLAGIMGFICGQVDLMAALHKPQPGIVLLFVTAPLGWVGLYTLWNLIYCFFKDIPVKNRRPIISGLIAGLVALLQMASIGIGVFLIVLPSFIYFAINLYQQRNHEL